MIYYNSRYISQRLDINLARWKRWVREFLPPDPLGGMQSGVTRQFNTKDAFKVYFGGYLVGKLKFSIPHALTVLTDLSPWLKDHGYYRIHTRPSLNRIEETAPHRLFIYPNHNRGFVYEMRTVVSTEIVDGRRQLQRERCSLIGNGRSGGDSDHIHPMFGFMVSLTELYTDFLRRLASASEHG